MNERAMCRPASLTGFSRPSVGEAQPATPQRALGRDHRFAQMYAILILRNELSRAAKVLSAMSTAIAVGPSNGGLPVQSL